MPTAYLEYVNFVTDHIAGCAGSLPHVRIAIETANVLLDECDVSVMEANWFWQTVAAELLKLRTAAPGDRAGHLAVAASEVLKELDSDGPLQ